jgi:23S rRNA U2552 (ribose-2'-O)-methylase RlmE/FtsJ
MGAALSGPATQQNQLNTVIAKQITDVMKQQKFSSASAITQNVNIAAVGPNSKVSGVDVTQVASINTTAFLSDSTRLDLMSDLKEKLTNSIKNEASNMPLGQQPNVNTTIANVVDKSVESKFSHQSMVELNSSVNQSANIMAGMGGEIDTIKLVQKANVIQTFANDVATDISTKLIGNTDVDNKNDTKSTNFLAETIGAVGNAITGFFSGILQSALIGPLLLFGMFLGVVLLALYIARGRGTPAPLPMYQYQGMSMQQPVGSA